MKLPKISKPSSPPPPTPVIQQEDTGKKAVQCEDLKPDRFVVIMAGGRGERFWPVSREKTPKQLIRLLGERSFLQQAVDRVKTLVPIENILIITNAVQTVEVRRQLPELPKNNVVGEPVGRDTCAAVALGAALVGARSSKAVMAVLPADHVIPNKAKFCQVLKDAFEVATHQPVIVTIGVQPTSPETGYGYIQTANVLPTTKGRKALKTVFFRAERFVEKPDLATAEGYLASGNYRWNAGMFVWSFATVSEALAEHQPELGAACQRWATAARKSSNKLTLILQKEYPGIRKISVDFALMEKAKNVVVADGSFDWDDLGAWPALARHVTQDSQGNAAVADFIHVDASGNIIFDGRTQGRTAVALVGVKDCIIVLTDDAMMVAAKSEAQKIKDLVKKLAADPKRSGLI